MNKEAIKQHIEKKEAEKADILKALQVMDKVSAHFSRKDMNKIEAVLSSAFAQCAISIRDHEKLL